LNKTIQTFEQYLANAKSIIPVTDFVLNLLLVVILAFLLSCVYIRYGRALSNRRKFARSFMLIAMTTMLIISIVKSSLALSLGLVGALSIVRFRTAIKDPEELSHMFLAIAIGLGLGADQRVITLVAVGIIFAVIILKNVASRREEKQNLMVTVQDNSGKKVELVKIIETLQKHCSAVDLKRFDGDSKALEASFLVEFDGVAQLNAMDAALRELSNSIKITFLDNSGYL